MIPDAMDDRAEPASCPSRPRSAKTLAGTSTSWAREAATTSSGSPRPIRRNLPRRVPASDADGLGRTRHEFRHQHARSERPGARRPARFHRAPTSSRSRTTARFTTSSSRPERLTSNRPVFLSFPRPTARRISPAQVTDLDVNFTTSGDPVTYQCEAHHATLMRAPSRSAAHRHLHRRHRRHHRRRHHPPPPPPPPPPPTAPTTASSSASTATARLHLRHRRPPPPPPPPPPPHHHRLRHLRLRPPAAATSATAPATAATKAVPCAARDRDDARPRAHEDPRARCTVGRIRRSRSRLIGRVIAQSPRGGTVHPRGTRIRLVVGRR